MELGFKENYEAYNEDFMVKFGDYASDLVLRRYYLDFETLFEDIMVMQEVNDQITDDYFHLSLLDERTKINRKSKELLNKALASYNFEFKAGRLHNKLTKETYRINNELLTLLNKKDIFHIEENQFKEKATHPEPKFNTIDQDAWDKIYENYQARIKDIEEKILLATDSEDIESLRKLLDNFSEITLENQTEINELANELSLINYNIGEKGNKKTKA